MGNVNVCEFCEYAATAFVDGVQVCVQHMEVLSPTKKRQSPPRVPSVLDQTMTNPDDGLDELDMAMMEWQ